MHETLLSKLGQSVFLTAPRFSLFLSDNPLSLSRATNILVGKTTKELVLAWMRCWMQEKLLGILERIIRALDVQECSEFSIYYNIFFLLSKYFGSSWKTTARGRMTVRKSVLSWVCSFFLNTNKFSPNVNVVSMCSYNLASWEIYGFFSEVKSNYAYLYKKKNVPPSFFLWG